MIPDLKSVCVHLAPSRQTALKPVERIEKFIQLLHSFSRHEKATEALFRGRIRQAGTIFAKRLIQESKNETY